MVTVALGLWLALGLLQSPAVGPVEPVWDFERCAYCRMHIGERGYAAQFHPESAEPVFFDDPGCLLLWRAEGQSAGEAYFRHVEQDRWIAEPDAVFVSAENTPMGWGFAVIDRSGGDGEIGDPHWSPDGALTLLQQKRTRPENCG